MSSLRKPLNNHFGKPQNAGSPSGSSAQKHRWEVPSRQLIAESQFLELKSVQKRVRSRSRKALLWVLAVALVLSVLAVTISMLLTEDSTGSYFHINGQTSAASPPFRKQQ